MGLETQEQIEQRIAELYTKYNINGRVDWQGLRKATNVPAKDFEDLVECFTQDFEGIYLPERINLMIQPEDPYEVIIHHKETPGKVLDLIAIMFADLTSGEPDEGHHYIVPISKHPNTLPKTLNNLSNYGCRIVKDNIARHPNTTTETLQKMLEENNCEPWNEPLPTEDESLYDRIRIALEKRQIQPEQRKPELLYKDPYQTDFLDKLFS